MDRDFLSGYPDGNISQTNPTDSDIIKLISFIVVAMNSRDQYKIIGLYKISRSIKQPCRSACLKKVLEMHQSC